MLGGHEDDDDGIFAALRFVDRARIGMHEFIEIGQIVADAASIHIHDDGFVLGVDGDDGADVPIKDILVVVIADLHDAVAQAVLASEAFDFIALRIERFLEDGVEVVGAEGAASHGGKDLDVGKGVHAKTLWNAFGDEV